MKTKTVIMFALAGLLIVLFAVPEAYARRGKGDNGKKEFTRVMEKLDLSAEQKEQIDSQRDEQKAQFKKVIDDLKKAKEALKDELDKPDSDQNAVDKLAARIKSCQGQLVDLRINGILAIKRILTLEQFVQMKGQMDLRREIREEMHEGRRDQRYKHKSMD